MMEDKYVLTRRCVGSILRVLIWTCCCRYVGLALAITSTLAIGVQGSCKLRLGNQTNIFQGQVSSSLKRFTSPTIRACRRLVADIADLKLTQYYTGPQRGE